MVCLCGIEIGSIDFFTLVADCYRLTLLRRLFLLRTSAIQASLIALGLSSVLYSLLSSCIFLESLFGFYFEFSWEFFRVDLFSRDAANSGLFAKNERRKMPKTTANKRKSKFFNK